MIEIKHLQKSFPGGRTVHQDILLRIPAGQMTVILGRSGEGKSLLLKQLIGLIEPTRGEIIINGISLQRSPASQRTAILQKCGYVFQFAALLDSLSVFENVDQSIFLSSDFRQSQSVRELTEVEYKPPACCDGIGSGFGASNISAPMMYQALAIMNTLSPQDGKDFSITCKLCKEVIMTVVHKGEPCPKCSRVRP